MRGSPLIRTLATGIALILAAMVLVHLNRRPKPAVVPPGDATAPHEAAAEPGIPTPFVLTLSEPAESVTLEAGGAVQAIDPAAETLSGTLELEPGHPSVFIDVTWRDREPRPRFAKLVLEPSGHPTATHYFDSDGPISDAWEIHLHP